EERVRATEASLGEARESAGRVSGALELVESALAVRYAATRPPPNEEGEPAGGRESDGEQTDSRPPGSADFAALARRAGDMRNELRVLLRADDPDYVYFVEFRGKGVFLRASPIDVSTIVREVLFDRMRTTVLT